MLPSDKRTPEETTYMIIDTFKTFEEVIQNLKEEYNHIQFCEGITIDEKLDLYLGFNNNIRENIRNHTKKYKYSRYQLTKEELNIVLQNMTMLHYSSLEGSFYFKPLIGKFGGHERINIRSEGNCFFKPNTMGKNKIKIVNSYFSYSGKAYINLSQDCRSLELQINKGRRIIDLKFVPKYSREY